MRKKNLIGKYKKKSPSKRKRMNEYTLSYFSKHHKRSFRAEKNGNSHKIFVHIVQFSMAKTISWLFFPQHFTIQDDFYQAQEVRCIALFQAAKRILKGKSVHSSNSADVLSYPNRQFFLSSSQQTTFNLIRYVFSNPHSFVSSIPTSCNNTKWWFCATGICYLFLN